MQSRRQASTSLDERNKKEFEEVRKKVEELLKKMDEDIAKLKGAKKV